MPRAVRRKTPDAPPADYETDGYGWAFEQARLLREGRFESLDIENIADEIESVGKTERFRIESALTLVLMHMLKWDHQPEKRTRSWTLTIAEQRKRYTRYLLKNRGLRQHLDEVLEDAYEDARLRAAAETDLPLKTFPETCPYDWDAILTRALDWPEDE